MNLSRLPWKVKRGKLESKGRDMSEDDEKRLRNIAAYHQHTYRLTELDGAVLARAILELMHRLDEREDYEREQRDK